MAAAALAYIRTETIPENNTGNEPDDDDDFFDTDVDTDTSTTSCSSIFTETLDYSYRNLSSIPEELLNSDEKRVKIRSLQLNSNSLLTLPAEMFERFLLLTTLEISNNQIVQFPREICLLKNLKNLFVKNNCLDDLSLPKEMEQLQQLEIVNFGGNRLKQYPYQLFQLTNLKEVYLGSNQIAFLPNLFDSLSKVEVLYLGGNQIPSIPDTIGLMKNLIVLNLSGNRLKTLPSTISHLTRLKSLSLHNNQFSTLPPDIIRLDLQELSLRNNPLIVR
ncbi:unnamed protein product [Didymodactylos carnosus]|nr:unnamed protein product [Didymodactylos carnosus]CAF4131443.1 unnamed protein product [Didymodactylos carnosus]